MEQVNHKTQKPYAGENQTALQEIANKNGFDSNEWLTFLQAKESGLKVKTGSKGVRLVKLIDDVVVDKKTGIGRSKFGIRRFTVFNINQCEKV